MKLTQDQIDDIYKLYSWYDSQRYIARRLGHGRGTISRYLEPFAIIEHFYIKEYDTKYKIIDLEEKISLWLNIAIVSFIGFIAQVLINIFF